MATRYSYPIDLHEEGEGGYSVTFPDFDEAFTDGDTLAEAVAEAGDCLEEALAGRIARCEDIPAPSPAKGRLAAVPGCMAHGDDQETALRNVKDAIEFWIERAQELGRPIPQPKGERLMYA